MTTVVVTARVPEGLAAWAGEYAGRRGVPRALIVEAALERFRELCGSSVPDLPEQRSKGRPAGGADSSASSEAPISEQEKAEAEAVAREARLAELYAKARGES